MNVSLSSLTILLLLSSVVACIAWTVTHEEIFRDVREQCQKRSKVGTWGFKKFFYVFTCEYCFSHYVTLAVLIVTRYKLLLNDWRGYGLAFFSMVWISNQLMSLYNRLRLDIKSTNLEDALKESTLKAVRKERAQL
ncbi:MAG TPA: hypothetical protein VI306_15240 [Pyrinomonadaceae bacterium]